MTRTKDLTRRLLAKSAACEALYNERLGFNVDHDIVIDENSRVVQLTPPQSGCSIVIGTGVVPEMPAGSVKGLQLVVSDIGKANQMLTARAS